MYRTNDQSRALEAAFVHEGVPYRIVGTTRFYDRREVRDVLSYLRWLANPADGLSLSRIINVPPRKIGDKTIAALRGWSEDNESTLWEAVQQADRIETVGSAATKQLAAASALFHDLQAFAREHAALDTLDYMLDQTGYSEWVEREDDGPARLENVEELRTVAQRYEGLEPEESLRGMLEQVALVSDADQVVDSGGATTLMTMHLAKGLEFDIVFLSGMEENVFPHARSLVEFGGTKELEEERRLCYVGITRARRMLYLTYGMQRMLMGRTSHNAPSRFLLDIPEELFTPDSNKPGQSTNRFGDDWGRGSSYRGDSDVFSTQPPPPTITESSFGAGEKVYHKHFGVGKVIESKLAGGDEEVTVEFMAKGEPVKKKLSVLLSGLEHA
jgi:DNA helicase-2/ATP-dependent DNA helicase PcrA